MGLYAHATHLSAPDKETGKFLAGALLRSPHGPVVATPYGKWLNAYLPLGLSYKDAPELPTATNIEINVYDGEGFDIRLFKADRLAYLFESNCGDDAAGEEDRLLEIASAQWKAEHPDEQRSLSSDEIDPHSEVEEDIHTGKDFWTLPEEEQEAYIRKARESAEFKAFQAESRREAAAPDCSDFADLLPEGKPLDGLKALLDAAARRLAGPPADGPAREALDAACPAGAANAKAEDYAAAIAAYLGLRGSLWSLDAIQDQLADKIDRRIIPIDALDARPKAT